MKSLTIKQIKPDSYYTAPLYLDDKYIITAPDIPVTAQLIEKLVKWQFAEVLTDGEPGSQPVIPDIEEAGVKAANLNDDLASQEIKNEAQVFFREICGFLENTFEIYKNKEIISYNHIIEQIKKIIPFIREKRNFILDMSNLKVTEHNYLISHSVKTALVSLALADFLKLPPHKTIELGTAALTHKIGMLKIPDSILTNPGGLKESEWKAIRAYPILGYKILQEASFPPAVSIAVLEHQERNNGAGYPRKLQGEQISFYGKIIAVISSYCAAIEKRPFKGSKDAHAGILDILKEMGKQYDDKIVRALIFTLSFYPIGTKVLLSNNSIAVVTKTNTGNPKEPVIKVLTSEDGTILTDSVIIDLTQNKKIQITRPLSQGEILKLADRIKYDS